MLNNLLPEVILILGSLILLISDIFVGKKLKDKSKLSFYIALIFATCSLIFVFQFYSNAPSSLFNKSLFNNKFTYFAKIIILISLLSVIIISNNFASLKKQISAEFFALIMLSTAGSMFLISSNDLLPFYLSLELQSLPLYILAALNKDSKKSSESAIKYFILGSVSSAILLLGISFVYGFSGTTNLSSLMNLIAQYKSYFSGMGDYPTGIILGLVLIFTGILFKISAAPFHMWSPDVYEGAPTSVTAFFATVVKFTMILVTLRIYIYIIHSWQGFNQIFMLVAILSFIVGSLGAIMQKNIKRMLAYSGISHVGFILAALVATNFESLKSLVLYSVVYSSLTIGSFAFLMLLFNKKTSLNEDGDNDKIYNISSLSGIAKERPIVALCLSIIMFSMAGIPPMAGFFAKFYVLLSIIKQELYFLAIMAVITTVISAFYYLRIVKTMYFDKKINDDVIIKSNYGAFFILFIAAIFNLSLIIFVEPFLEIILNIFE
jgi:NADH-quinone oxidoreductase subunit N